MKKIKKGVLYLLVALLLLLGLLKLPLVSSQSSEGCCFANLSLGDSTPQDCCGSEKCAGAEWSSVSCQDAADFEGCCVQQTNCYSGMISLSTCMDDQKAVRFYPAQYCSEVEECQLGCCRREKSATGVIDAQVIVQRACQPIGDFVVKNFIPGLIDKKGCQDLPSLPLLNGTVLCDDQPAFEALVRISSQLYALTNSSGQYSLSLPADSWTVTVSASGCQDLTETVVVSEEGATHDFDLGSGLATGTLSGFVFEPGGQTPVVNAYVFSVTSQQSAYTNYDGYFSLSGLQTDDNNFRVSHSDFESLTHTININAGLNEQNFTFTERVEKMCGDGVIDNSEDCDPEANKNYYPEDCLVCTDECKCVGSCDELGDYYSQYTYSGAPDGVVYISNPQCSYDFLCNNSYLSGYRVNLEGPDFFEYNLCGDKVCCNLEPEPLPLCPEDISLNSVDAKKKISALHHHYFDILPEGQPPLCVCGQDEIDMDDGGLCCPGTPYDYFISGGSCEELASLDVVVKREKTLFRLFSSEVSVEDATVEIVELRSSESTDENGLASFADIPPGSYTVKASYFDDDDDDDDDEGIWLGKTQSVDLGAGENKLELLIEPLAPPLVCTILKPSISDASPLPGQLVINLSFSQPRDECFDEIGFFHVVRKDYDYSSQTANGNEKVFHVPKTDSFKYSLLDNKDLEWDKWYEYTVKVYNLSGAVAASSNHQIVFTGNESCQSRLPGQTFCSDDSLVLSCDDSNKLVEVDSCDDSCLQINPSLAACRLAEECQIIGTDYYLGGGEYEQPNIFGLYYSQLDFGQDGINCTHKLVDDDIVRTSCYLDYSETTIDKCFSCLEVEDEGCYAYQSQSACLADSCGFSQGQNCSWIASPYAELGKGTCLPPPDQRDPPENCDDVCSGLGPFEECSPDICWAYGCVFDADNDACVDCSSLSSCFDYQTEQECVGTPPYNQSFSFTQQDGSECVSVLEQSIVYSHDACGFGYCAWQDDGCVRVNALGDNECAEEISSPPQTNLSISDYLSTSQGQLSFEVSTAQLPPFCSKDISTYYCVDKEGFCCPDELVPLDNILTFADINSSLTFGGGYYQIHYFSNDSYGFVEPVQSSTFYFDNLTAGISLSYDVVDNPNDERTSDILFELNLSHPAACSDILAIMTDSEWDIDQNLTDDLVRAGQIKSFEYLDKSDGVYYYILNCTTPAGNSEVIVESIDVDRIALIENVRVNNNTLPVLINGSANITWQTSDEMNCSLSNVPVGTGTSFEHSMNYADGNYSLNISCSKNDKIDSFVSTVYSDTVPPQTTLLYKGKEFNQSKVYNDALKFSFYVDTSPGSSSLKFTGSQVYSCFLPGTDPESLTCNSCSSFALVGETVSVGESGLLCYYSVDEGGNKEDYQSASVVIDITAPEILKILLDDVLIAQNKILNYSSPVLKVWVDEPGQVKVSLNGQTTSNELYVVSQDYYAPFSLNLQPGQNSLVVRAFDSAQNPSTHFNFDDIYFDTFAPNATLTIYDELGHSPPQNLEWQHSITFNVTDVVDFKDENVVNDELDAVKRIILNLKKEDGQIIDSARVDNGVSLVKQLTRVDANDFVPGNYTAELILLDKFDNVATLTSSFYINDTSAPAINVTFYNLSGPLTNHTVNSQVLERIGGPGNEFALMISSDENISSKNVVVLDSFFDEVADVLSFRAQTGDYSYDYDFNHSKLGFVSDIFYLNITLADVNNNLNNTLYAFYVDNQGDSLIFVEPASAEFYTNQDEINLTSTGMGGRPFLQIKKGTSFKKVSFDSVTSFAYSEFLLSSCKIISSDNNILTVENCDSDPIVGNFVTCSGASAKRPRIVSITNYQQDNSLNPDQFFLELNQISSCDNNLQLRDSLYPNNYFWMEVSLPSFCNNNECFVFGSSEDDLGNYNMVDGDYAFFRLFYDSTAPLVSSPLANSTTNDVAAKVKLLVSDNLALNSSSFQLWLNQNKVAPNNYVKSCSDSGLSCNLTLSPTEGQNWEEFVQQNITLNISDLANNLVSYSFWFIADSSTPARPNLSVTPSNYLNNLFYTNSSSPLIYLEYNTSENILFNWSGLYNSSSSLVFNNFSNTLSPVDLVDGSYTLKANASKQVGSDAQGEPVSGSFGFWGNLASLIVDTQPPSSALSAPVSVTDDKSVQVLVNASDSNLWFVNLSGHVEKSIQEVITSDLIGESYSLNLSYCTAGNQNNTLLLSVCDKAGNCNQTSLMVVCHNSSPIFVVDSINVSPLDPNKKVLDYDGFDSSWHTNTLALNISGRFSAQTFDKIYLEDSSPQLFAQTSGDKFWVNLSLEDNPNSPQEVTLVIKDENSRTGTITVNITYDTQGPSIARLKPVSDYVSSDTFEFRINASDDVVDSCNASVSGYSGLSFVFNEVYSQIFNTSLNLSICFNADNPQCHVETVCLDKFGNSASATFVFSKDIFQPQFESITLEDGRSSCSLVPGNDFSDCLVSYPMQGNDHLADISVNLNRNPVDELVSCQFNLSSASNKKDVFISDYFDSDSVTVGLGQAQNLSLFDNDNYTLGVACLDGAGNSNSTQVKFQVETGLIITKTYLQVETQNFPPGSYLNSDSLMVGVETNKQGVTCELYNTSLAEESIQTIQTSSSGQDNNFVEFSLSDLVDGSYSFVVVCSLTGNLDVSSPSEFVSFTLDSTLPLINLSASRSGQPVSFVRDGDVIDVLALINESYLNQSQVKFIPSSGWFALSNFSCHNSQRGYDLSCSANLSVNQSEDSPLFVGVSAVDLAGNFNSSSLSLIVDNTPPGFVQEPLFHDLTFTNDYYLSSCSLAFKKLTLNFTSDETLASASLIKDISVSECWNLSQNVWVCNLTIMCDNYSSPGFALFNLSLVDLAGNQQSFAYPDLLFVDAHKPNITVFLPGQDDRIGDIHPTAKLWFNDNNFNSSQIIITSNVTDEFTSCSNHEELGDNHFSSSCSATGDILAGENESLIFVNVSLTDLVGNFENKDWSFFVDKNVPPLPSLTAYNIFDSAEVVRDSDGRYYFNTVHPLIKVSFVNPISYFNVTTRSPFPAITRLVSGNNLFLLNYSGLSQGYFSLKVEANLSHISSAPLGDYTFSDIFVVDTQPPSLTIISPASDEIIPSGQATLEVGVDDAHLDSVNYSVYDTSGDIMDSGQLVQTNDYRKTLGLGNGQYSLVVVACDKAGNCNTSSCNFTLDIGVPGIVVTEVSPAFDYGQEWHTLNSSVTISGNLSKPYFASINSLTLSPQVGDLTNLVFTDDNFSLTTPISTGSSGETITDFTLTVTADNGLSNSTLVNVVHDRQGPQISLVSPLPDSSGVGWVNNDNPFLVFETSEVSNCSFSYPLLGGGDSIKTSPQYALEHSLNLTGSVEIPVEGLTLEATCWDRFNNPLSKSFILKKDLSPPEIKASLSPSIALLSQETSAFSHYYVFASLEAVLVTIESTAQEGVVCNMSGDYKWQNNTYQSTHSLQLPQLVDQANHSYSLSCSDRAGNSDSYQLNLTTWENMPVSIQVIEPPRYTQETNPLIKISTNRPAVCTIQTEDLNFFQRLSGFFGLLDDPVMVSDSTDTIHQAFAAVVDNVEGVSGQELSASELSSYSLEHNKDYSFDVECQPDQSGLSLASALVSFTTDFVVDNFTIHSPVNNQPVGSWLISVNGSVDEPVTLNIYNLYGLAGQYDVNGSFFFDKMIPVFPNPLSGSLSDSLLIFEAVDRAGNVEAIERTVKKDISDLQISATITYPFSGSILASLDEVKAHIVPNGTGWIANLTVFNTSGQEVTPAYDFVMVDNSTAHFTLDRNNGLADGTYTLLVTPSLDGIEGLNGFAVITINSSVPEINLLSPEFGSVVTSSTVPFTVDITPALGAFVNQAWIYYNWFDPVELEYIAQDDNYFALISGLADMNYLIGINATDNLGRTGFAKGIIFVDTTGPGVENVTVE